MSVLRWVVLRFGTLLARESHRAVRGALTLLMASWAASSIAGTSEQVPLGARAIAMGGAYSAASDDATSMFWNPAGLVGLPHQELVATHANLFDSGIKDDFIAFALPLSRTRALGLDWYHSGFSDDTGELDFGENRFDLAFGAKLLSRFLPDVSLGVTTKYLRRDASLDGTGIPQAQGWGVGLDAGILANPWERWRFALVAQDVTSTRVHYSDGTSSVVFPRNIRGAAAYTIGRFGLATFDIDDRAHLGVEVAALDNVALRGGAQRDLDGEESPTYAFGAGFKVAFLRADYAYEIHPVLPATHHMTAAFELNLNPSRLSIDAVRPENLFASHYLTYTEEPTVDIVLRNLEDKPLDLDLSVTIPGYTEKPTESQVSLGGKATRTIHTILNVPERVMRQSGDRSLQVRVAANYQSRRFPRTDRATATCTGYAPGSVALDRGPAPVAAFVTTQDPVVAAFAQNAKQAALSNKTMRFNIPNVDLAAAVFDALTILGIKPQKDPLRFGSQAIDGVRYPRETFESRVGDCDDTTVLVAALLGALGVNSQFLMTRDHLFLMFDSGFSELEQDNLTLPAHYSVKWAGRTWIPLETASIPDGFASAWFKAADDYESFRSQDAILYSVDVAAAQSRYLPASPTHGAVAAPGIDSARLMGRFAMDVERFRDWRDVYLKEK